MKKLTVSYTAVYPSNAFDLVEVLLNVTGNNIEAFEKLLDLRDAYPGFYNWYYRKVKQDIKKKGMDV